MTKQTISTFYRENPVYLHYYTFPLLLIPLSMASKLYFELSILLASISFVMFLSTYWTVKSLVFQCYSVEPNGNKLIYMHEITTRTFQNEESYFTYRFEKYKLEKDGTVSKVEAKSDFSLEDFRSLKIHQENYGILPENKLVFPEKTFLSLFKESVVSPLFCFQILASILTIFENYVYNSLFSIAMTVGLEAMMVVTRLITLKMFRNYTIKEQKIRRLYVGNNYKVQEDELVPSTSLRPGDVISLEGVTDLSCDCLLIKGKVVVNEAMLSGESVPVIKEEITAKSEIYDLKKHKRYTLFSGTKIEKVINSDDQSVSDQKIHIDDQFNEQTNTRCVAVVLRTGFDTEQGKLLNTMLHSEEMKYDKEALHFVIGLSFISLIAAILTFFFSKKTGYPLFLDILVLFTNSIPFELPMEMGVSVQLAVKNLMGKSIFCLEPFRLTFAGKLNVCCFDKTGTLTSSVLEFKEIKDGNEMSEKLLTVCHSLVELNGKLQGDALEMSILKFLENQNFKVETSKILRNFSFNSDLKRQGVVAKIDGRIFFVTKGAPEVIEGFLEKSPANYSNYKNYASMGFRVISLAFKEIDQNNSFVRSQLETKLKFAGFILFGSTLKQNAKEMVNALYKSNHKIVMITGDNLLTALNVAEQLGMKGVKGVEGASIDGILAGDSFEEFSVFARADPKHKEQIIKRYKALGKVTMMVGDGTNDVGALKAADVGVAVMEPLPEKKKKLEPAQGLKALEELSEFVKPGDASVAAPFTVRSHSLEAILEIVRQGRTSAVTTVQMYKILALNSLIGGFTMGFLDLFAIKYSEKQMLSLGYFNAVAFNAITRGKPLPEISPERVVDSIFNNYIVLSLLGQATLHTLCFVALVFVLRKTPEIRSYYSSSTLTSEKFSPSVVNTTIYALSLVQTLATYVFNYIGRPFREDIAENTLLLLSLVGMTAVPLSIIYNFFPDISNFLECVDVGEYKGALALLCGLLLILTYFIESLSKKYFMIKKTS